MALEEFVAIMRMRMVVGHEADGRTSLKEVVHANQGSGDIDLDCFRAVEVWGRGRILREDLVVSSGGRGERTESSLLFLFGHAPGNAGDFNGFVKEKSSEVTLYRWIVRGGLCYVEWIAHQFILYNARHPFHREKIEISSTLYCRYNRDGKRAENERCWR